MTIKSEPPPELREAASLIGFDLCRRAYWDVEGRLCNWVSRSSNEVAPVGDSITPTAKALGIRPL